MEKGIKSSVIDSNAQKKQVEFVLFFAIWDEEEGPEVLNFYPKSSLLDLESLANSIFATYQLLWNKPDEQFKKTKVTLPVVNLNRKAHILLDLIHNREVRGGFQPFIVVLLVPDYFTDESLGMFDGVLSKIAKKYMNDQKVLLFEGYEDIEEIYEQKQEFKESKVEIDDYYSYTVAINDFKAGVTLFQTRNYDDAYPLLHKALLKFEKEDHKSLLMEVTYLIASIFAQKKQFNVAENHYLRLELLAEELDHQKYKEMSIFMSGFCAYKNERYVEAIQQFSKIELFKKQFINEFQYHTMYGRALEKLQNYEDSIKKLKFALRIIETQEKTLAIKKQQSQIKYELGIVYYKLAIEKTKESGIKKQEDFKDILDEAVDYFEQSCDIWKDIGDNKQIISTYSLIGDIFEFLGDDSKFFEYYNTALKHAEKSQIISNQIKLLKRIIQKQAILGLYEENIKSISSILDKFDNYRLFDLHTASILHKHLGMSLVKTNQINEGLTELVIAYEILEKFKEPVDDELQILNRIIILYNKIGDEEKIAYYSEKRDAVSAKLKIKETEKTKKVKNLAILKDIWIFSKSIGIELYSYSIETKVETDLLGGFMTAIQALSQEVAYKNIDSMIFGDDRFTIYHEEDREFYILARSSAKVSEETSEKVLSIVYNRFWKEFSNEINDFVGNVKPFQKFTGILESFDWTLLSIEKEREKIVSRITGTRAEMKELVTALPDDTKALPMDEAAIPASEDLKAKALEKRKQLMETPMFMDDLKAQEVSDDDVAVFKERRICLVHKGPIEGYIFMCPGCDAFYCVKCVDALIEIENFCWSCSVPLDPSKPSEKDDQKEKEDEPTIEGDIIEEEGEIEPKGAKKAEPHKGPKVDPHKGPKADPHKGPKADPHKGLKADPHKGPKAEASQKTPKKETLRIAAKKKKVDN